MLEEKKVPVPEGLWLDWGGGHFLFRLDIGDILELEEVCDAGLVTILNRLHSSTWRANDIRETIRLGFEGGGRKNKPQTPSLGQRLVKRYIDDPDSDLALLDHVTTAIAILSWRLAGAPKEEKKKVGEGGESGSEVSDQETEASGDEERSSPATDASYEASSSPPEQ